MPVTLPFDNLDMPLPLLDSASFVDLPRCNQSMPRTT